MTSWNRKLCVAVFFVFLSAEPCFAATTTAHDIHQQVSTLGVAAPHQQEQQQPGPEQQQQPEPEQQQPTSNVSTRQIVVSQLLQTDAGGMVFLGIVVLIIIGIAVGVLVKFNPNRVPTDSELESVGRSKRFLSRFSSLIGILFCSVLFQYFDEQSAVDGGTGLMVLSSFLLVLLIERFRYFNSGVERSQASEDKPWYGKARSAIDYARYAVAAVLLLVVAATVFMDPSSVDPIVSKVLVIVIMSLMFMLSAVVAFQVVLEGTQTTGISTADSRSKVALVTPVLVLLFMILSLIFTDLEFVFRVFAFSSFFLGNNLIDEVLSREGYSKLGQLVARKRRGSSSDVDVGAIFRSSGLAAKPIACTAGTVVKVSEGRICVPEEGSLLPLSLFLTDAGPDKALEHAVRMLDLAESLTTTKDLTLKTFKAPIVKLKAKIDDIPKVPLEQPVGEDSDLSASMNGYVFELEGKEGDVLHAVLHSTLPPAVYDVEHAPSKTIEPKESTTGTTPLAVGPFIPSRMWPVPVAQLEVEDAKEEIVHFRLPQEGDKAVVLRDTTPNLVKLLEEDVNPWNLISQHGPVIGDLGQAAIGESGVICNLQASQGLSAYLVKGTVDQLDGLTQMGEKQQQLAVSLKKFHREVNLELHELALQTATLIGEGKVGTFKTDTEVVIFVLYNEIPSDVVNVQPTRLPDEVASGDGITEDDLDKIRAFAVSKSIVRLFSQP